MADDMTNEMPIEQFRWASNVRGMKESCVLHADVGLEEPLPIPLLQVSGAQPGPKLLVLAGVHGDEYEGMETVLRLFHTLDPAQIVGTVVMVPVTNPFSYAGEKRCSPVDGANMARTFPGKRDGSPTEQLAYHVHHTLLAGADFLLDLHSGGTHYAVATLVGYYDNDASDTGVRSRAAAEAFGIDLLWAHAAIAPGRTVSSATALGIPWLYTEAYGGKRIRPDEAEQFYAGTLRLMRHLGMLPQTSEANREPQRAMRRIYGDGNFDASSIAESDGFFVPNVPLGAELKSGERIGTIYGLDASLLQHIDAERDGVLVMMAGTPKVGKGDPLYMLASCTPQ